MPDLSIFRTSALQHHFNRDTEGVPVPLRIAPAWTWGLCWVMVGLLVLAAVLSFTMRVEVNDTGRGQLHLASGARPLIAPVGGTVVRIHVKNGQRVCAGDILLELDAAAVQSQLFEAERALQQLDRVARPAQGAMEELAHQQEREILRRLASLRAQVQSQEQSISLYERKHQANETLAKEGLVAQMNVEDSKEAVAQARRALAAAQQSMMSVQQEYQAFQSRRKEDQLQHSQEAQTIRTKRDALAISLAQLQMRAPEAGIVDGLYVRIGDVVASSQEVVHLVPEGAALRAFTLLPEKDRAFLKVGDGVRLEVSQYPPAEFGTLGSRVLRIGEVPATQAELKDVLGDATKVEDATYLVELVVVPDERKPIARQSLRTGMEVQARYTLRRQRPITLLLEPLHRWLE